jgi:hypothetical protein
MKRFFTIILLSVFSVTILTAQTRTVNLSLGKGYAKLAWYDLIQDSTSTAPLNAWDLAIMTIGQNATIRINSGFGCRLWEVVGKTSDDFGNPIDTTGLTTDSTKFIEWIDSDQKWQVGAFNMDKDGYEDNGDFGWGDYNMSTHAIHGSKLFILLGVDNKYHQIRIEDLLGGVYYFAYSDIDGSNQKEEEFNKQPYNTKTFAYYSISTNPGQKLDLEPGMWSLVFGKYIAKIDNGNGNVVPYTVTGVRTNYGWTSVKVSGQDPATVNPPTASQFSDIISTIGYTWKTLDQNYQYQIPGDICYFVQSPDGLAWKIVFKSFEGSSTGNLSFEQTPVKINSVKDNSGNTLGSFGITPNIIEVGSPIQFSYSVTNTNATGNIAIYNLSSQKVFETNLPSANFNAMEIQPTLPAGMYFVVFSVNGHQEMQKLIVK